MKRILPIIVFLLIANMAYAGYKFNPFTGKLDDASGSSGSSTEWDNDGTNILSSDSFANVGIGTPTPTSKLQVAGDIDAQVITVNGVSVCLQGTNCDYVGSAGGWTDGGTNIFNSTTTDNVGIGTTTPIAKLHVVGTTLLEGTVTAGGAGTNIEFQNNMRIDGLESRVLKIKQTDGTYDSSIGIDIDSAEGVAEFTSDSVVPIETVKFTDMALQVVGTVNAIAFVGDGSGLTGISGGSGGWVDGGTNIYASPTTDNVAIGTTTPTQKLTVVGTVAATSFTGDGSALTGIGSGGWTDGGSNVYVATTTDNVAIGTTTPTAALLIENAGTQDSFRVNDGVLDSSPFVINSAGNVGIGTSTSSTFMSIISPASTANGVVFSSTSQTSGNQVVCTNVTSTSALTGACGHFSFTGANNLGTPLFTQNTGNGPVFQAWDQGSDPSPFYIATDGNVGVGTNAPTGKMDIRGDEVRVWTGAGTVNNATASGELYVEGDLEVDGTLYGDGSGLTGISGGVGIGTANTITFWPTTTTIGSLPTATYPSLTELSYVKGATSNIQTQIDGLSVGSGGWTDGGTNVYPTTTTDAVGIGTHNVVSGSILTIKGTVAGSGSGPIAFTDANVGIGTTTAGSLLVIGTTGQASITSSGVATLPTPNLTGKIDINNTSVSDDDCSGEQGLFWFDSTDNQFEFCHASSGVPFVIGIPTPPAQETITAGATITADACGTYKEIASAGAVTTNTTNTFTAPTTAMRGCCMYVVNAGANNITLDNNANFYSVGAADVVLGLADSALVCTNGIVWVQMGGSNN